ncbi:MAG: Gfo/Idh/MocA family oxidoreductase [Propionibacteriaceae bacterium]
MDNVRWGIIGVGDVTERKSGPGFQRAERSELVAVMRRSGDLAADYARRHGVPRWYDDADALINDPEVDAVYVATPPDSHCDYTLQAAAAGKPVYVEKPMARTEAECQTMIDACEAAGVDLYVAYYRRAMPRFGLVKSLLDHGRLGDLRTVSIRNERLRDAALDPVPWRLRPEISGGGNFVDLGSHALDLLDFLLGPITSVSGTAVSNDDRFAAEDLVTGLFSFSSGVEGVGSWNYDGHTEIDEVEISGTAGSLRFSVFGQEPLRLSTGSGSESIEAPYPETVQQPLIQHVVDSLTGRGTSPSTGATAIRTARVIDTVLADYRAAHGIRF